MTNNTLEICIAGNDAYSGVCSKLVKLCPRLVPRPLWRLSLAGIARMAPQAALAICDPCPETVEKIHRYWMTLDRSGKCEVCGESGNEVDEDWLYCIFDENGNLVKDMAIRNPTPMEARRYKGVAYLQKLKLLCEKCHLAKHQGYALVHGRKQEVLLEHLARINQLNLEETKNLVGKAFSIHHQLSKIHAWIIKIEGLEGLDEELRRRLEELLNIMYRKGFLIYEGWLYYHYPKYGEEVKSRIIHETVAILAEISKKSGTTNVADDIWIDNLLKIVKKEIELKNIRVLSREFRLFIKYLLEDERRRKLLQRVVDYIPKSKTKYHKSVIFLLLNHVGLTGKWMVFVPTNLCPRIFHYMLDALEKAKLAYSAKITSQREEYNSRRELPIIVYVPISFAARYIVDVAEVMKSVLDDFHVNKKMFFKPDLFTEKGIYSGRVDHKPYIYTY